MIRRLFLILALTAGVAFAQNITLNALFMQQAAYSTDNVKAMTADFEKANPGVKVNLEFVSYEALHNKIVTSEAAGHGYDVVLFDVIWPAEFATNHILRNITSDIPQSMIDKVWSGAWTTVKYKDQYYGIPWILDTKYLYYNKKMLQEAGISNPPTTWDELAKDAKIIKDKGIVKYPMVWSWQQAEAIMCDYTTLLSAYGGSYFDQNNNPTFQTGGGLKALQYMNQTLKDGISNPASTESLEEDVRRIFSSGQAAFALNWTYMYNLANDPKQSKVAGDVGIEPAPGDGTNSQMSAVNGSMGLGVTTSSKHPNEALKYIEFLTSQKEQNQYAKLSLPIWKSSYDNPDVTKGQEALIAAAKKALPVMYPRPMLVHYQQFSNTFQAALNNVLIGNETPTKGLDTVAQQIKQQGLNK